MPNNNNKIVSARITALPKKLTDSLPRVYVEYANGLEEFLFDYFPDEVSFTSAELVGLTRGEAIALKYQKDLAFLRSR